MNFTTASKLSYRKIGYLFLEPVPSRSFLASRGEEDILVQV